MRQDLRNHRKKISVNFLFLRSNNTLANFFKVNFCRILENNLRFAVIEEGFIQQNCPTCERKLQRLLHFNLTNPYPSLFSPTVPCKTSRLTNTVLVKHGSPPSSRESRQFGEFLKGPIHRAFLLFDMCCSFHEKLHQEIVII